MSDAIGQPEGKLPLAVDVEEIPDCDFIARLVDTPRMYSEGQSLIWNCVFEFPQSQGESVVWSKYAHIPAGVHCLGCAREKDKRSVKPDFCYSGFISALVREVRTLQNARGHGFFVVHEPSQGIHHAEVQYCQNPKSGESIKKADRVELKMLLRKAFGDLIPHAC